MDERVRHGSVGAQIVAGLLGAARRWPLALALYLPNLLLGLLSAVVVYRAGLELATIGPWTARLAEGDLANTLLELTASAGAEVQPAVADFSAGLASAGLWLLLGVPLQWLLYNLLAGAVLARLAGRETSFWAAVGRWVGPMLLFGLLALPVFLLLGVVGIIVAVLLPFGGGDGLVAQGLLALTWLACVNGFLELARANMVARDERNPAAALGLALRALARPGLLGAALLLWLALALVGGLYVVLTGGVVGTVPAALLLPAILAHQLVAFLGAWLKLLRLGAALALARAAE